MVWTRKANRFLRKTTGLEIRKAGTAHASTAKAATNSAQPLVDFDDPAKLPPRLRTFDLPPGAAVSARFFDQYPRFYGDAGFEMSRRKKRGSDERDKKLTAHDRLNLRYEAIFHQNRDIIEGARVLDVAAHDGRWSFAAVKTGAAHLTSIEGREELVAAARESFAHYDIDPNSYRLLHGDMFEVLAREEFDVDVICCLGFMYHTLRYNELLSYFRRINPKYLIIDTTVIASPDAMVKLTLDPVDVKGNAIHDRFAHGDQVLVGTPSLKGLRRMLGAYDFKIERLSAWGSLLRDNPEMLGGAGGYIEGKRITARVASV